MNEEAEPAQAPSNAAFFTAPRRRRKLIAGIAAAALVAVVTFIYLAVQGPDNRSIALQMVEQTVNEFSGQTLAPLDLRQHAKRLSEALELAPEEEATAAAVERLKGQLHAQLVGALALDALDDTEALLAEANVLWPDEEAFKSYGQLATQLNQRQQELQLREELLVKLNEAQAKVEGESSTLDAIRATLGLVEELLDQYATLKSDSEINANLRNLLTVGARSATREDEIRSASALLDASRVLWQDDAGLGTLDQDIKSKLGELDRGIEIRELISLGQERLRDNLLTTPAGKSARDAFSEVLTMDPGNAEALDGLRKVANRYVELIGSAINNNSLTRAKQHLSSLEALDANHVAIQPLKERLSDKERLLELERLSAEQPASIEKGQQKDVQATQLTANPLPADDEGTLWLQVRDFCAMLDQYIIKHPSGRYVEEAWQRKSECLKQ